MSTKVYEIVANKIIEKLNEGIVPWRRPWNLRGLPTNFISKRTYRGINLFLLSLMPYESPYWLSFSQAKAKGGKIRKGQHGTIIVFWKLNEYTDPLTGETKKIPFIRFYNGFNLEQTEGIAIPKTTIDHNPIEACEQIIANMPNAPQIVIGGDQACYSRRSDSVSIPPLGRFSSPESYYASLFHELAHATAHESRLHRELGKTFGDNEYAFEELIAEMTAAMLCGTVGIENNVIESSASYIAHWKAQLTNNPKAIVQAASMAQKAADCILGISFKKNAEETDNETDDENAEANQAA